MSFTRPQQGVFRPMVQRAWLAHAAAEGLPPRDAKAKDAWYRAELTACLGRATTKDADPGRDFEIVMAHFEVFVGGEIYWNLRLSVDGAIRRLRWHIAQICARWDIDDAYARATAARILKWKGHLGSLNDITDPRDLQRVRVALIMQARRQGNREATAAAQAKPVTTPGMVAVEFESPGVRARREAREKTSREIRRELSKPRKAAPSRQPQPAEATIDPGNCPF